MTITPSQFQEFERRAVESWNSIGPLRAKTWQVKTLQADSKSVICRLRNADPATVSVIAKRSISKTALIEQTIYQEILPHIPDLAPRYFGSVEEKGGAYRWIFVEDVDDGECSDFSKEYAVLAAQWMAVMHTSSSRVPAVTHLPKRGPDYHLQRLLLTMQNMLRQIHMPGADEEVSQAQDGFLRLCDILYKRWYMIEDFCFGIPVALVHGDFAPENVRIRRTKTSASLLAFDWEKAGLGIPSIDLPAAQAECYRDGVSRFWPDLDLDRVQKMQAHGTIWQILSHNLTRKSAKKLLRYRSRLAEAMRSADLWQGTL